MTDPVLDHLVFGVPDLAAAVRWFAQVTGVRPAPGGRHVGLPSLTLVSLEAVSPRPESVRSALAALGVSVPVLTGNRDGLVVRLEGPAGPVLLV